MKRNLSLRKEAMAELTPADLGAVGGQEIGVHTASVCTSLVLNLVRGVVALTEPATRCQCTG